MSLFSHHMQSSGKKLTRLTEWSYCQCDRRSKIVNHLETLFLFLSEFEFIRIFRQISGHIFVEITTISADRLTITTARSRIHSKSTTNLRLSTRARTLPEQGPRHSASRNLSSPCSGCCCSLPVVPPWRSPPQEPVGGRGVRSF